MIVSYNNFTPHDILTKKYMIEITQISKIIWQEYAKNEESVVNILDFTRIVFFFSWFSLTPPHYRQFYYDIDCKLLPGLNKIV